jgi:hypothetical protein
MFSMLCGAWPRLTSDGVDVAALEAAVGDGRAGPAELEEAVGRLVSEVIAAQVDAGMDLVTDGQVRWPDMSAAVLAAIAAGRLADDRPLVAAWTAAAAAAPEGITVAQAVPGPYTLGRLAIDDAVARTLEAGETPPAGNDLLGARADVTMAIASALADEIEALAAAGCRMVMVEEPDATRIGADDRERVLFAGAGERLLAKAGGVHAMLVVTGGSAHEAGGSTIFAAPWASLLVDLIAGPDNWKLVREAPGDRGIVCAALPVRDDDLEVDHAPELVWAAGYAASANGRGFARVGLANATSLAGRTPEQARRVLAQLATATRYAGMPLADAVEAGLDPRTIEDPRPVPDRENRAARRRKAREARKDDGATG